MIEQFRRKTIWILRFILWGVIFAILMTLNVFNYHSNIQQAKRLLVMQDRMADGEKSQEVNPPMVNGQELTNIYAVVITEDGEYSFSGHGYMDENKTSELSETAESILSLGKESGSYQRYRFHVIEQDGTTIVSFLDYSIWKQQQSRMIMYSAIVMAIGIGVMFFVARFLGVWMTKPVIEAFEKQKQFISDAGHELKTPLAVVRSSLDMLENEIQGNKYLSYIRKENNRMTELAQDLLLLTNLETPNLEACHEKIDLSRNLLGAVLPFEAVAFEKEVVLDYQVEDNIFIIGDEKQIRKLIDVLLDNAMKHVYQNGKVAVMLKCEKERAILSVSNEGKSIPEGEHDKIFDRFYRGDKSRDHKAGRYGLGLSIAKVIVTAHKGKISVASSDGLTIFSVQFPKG